MPRAHKALGRSLFAMAKDEGLRQTKIEKTGDRTFNVHTEDGGHFECNSPVKLDRMKHVNHVKSESAVFAGVGDKSDMVCGTCGKKVLKLRGRFDRKASKIVYVCDDCR